MRVSPSRPAPAPPRALAPCLPTDGPTCCRSPLGSRETCGRPNVAVGIFSEYAAKRKQLLSEVKQASFMDGSSGLTCACIRLEPSTWGTALPPGPPPELPVAAQVQQARAGCGCAYRIKGLNRSHSLMYSLKPEASNAHRELCAKGVRPQRQRLLI